jgi:hypothetical protein
MAKTKPSAFGGIGGRGAAKKSAKPFVPPNTKNTARKLGPEFVPAVPPPPVYRVRKNRSNQ